MNQCDIHGKKNKLERRKAIGVTNARILINLLTLSIGFQWLTYLLALFKDKNIYVVEKKFIAAVIAIVEVHILSNRNRVADSGAKRFLGSTASHIYPKLKHVKLEWMWDSPVFIIVAFNIVLVIKADCT